LSWPTSLYHSLTAANCAGVCKQTTASGVAPGHVGALGGDGVAQIVVGEAEMAQGGLVEHRRAVLGDRATPSGDPRGEFPTRRVTIPEDHRRTPPHLTGALRAR